MIDLVSMAGGLSLARMKPVLEAASSSFLAEVDAIVDGCGAIEIPEYAEEIASLTGLRNRIGMLEDSFESTYFQSTAAGVAILVASEGVSEDDRERRIRSSVANFWDSCDDILQAGDGFLRPEFRGIKTTLRGVDDIWHNGDIDLLSEESEDIQSAYSRRLLEIQSKYPKRREIARVLAECAGW